MRSLMLLLLLLATPIGMAFDAVVIVGAFAVVGGLLAAPAQASIYYVDPAHGNDAGTGDWLHPWASIHQANVNVLPGDEVRLAPANYNDAPRAGVRWIGAMSATITPAVHVTSGMRLNGLKLAGGVDVDPGAADWVIFRCGVADHIGVWGDWTRPTAGWFKFVTAKVSSWAEHQAGLDRDGGAAPLSPSYYRCDFTIERKAGTKGVGWRRSGVSESDIDGCRLKIIQPDDFGGNDDSAAWKWFYSRRNRLRNTIIDMENSTTMGAGTGPFGPMWRDSTSDNLVENVVIRTSGSAIVSFCSAGTCDQGCGQVVVTPNGVTRGYCTCVRNRFIDLTIEAPNGTIRFSQCPLAGKQDVFERTVIRAHDFDPYKTGPLPDGIEDVWP